MSRVNVRLPSDYLEEPEDKGFKNRLIDQYLYAADRAPRAAC